MNTYKWKLIHQVPHGHRYYRDESTGRVAVADDSGCRPDQTEDGVLWVDPSRSIRIADDGVLVPIVSPAGRQFWTGEAHAADGIETTAPWAGALRNEVGSGRWSDE